MKIVYNKWIPFKGFCAINLFGVIFARKGCKVTPRTINHEKIHTAQMRELGYIGFYVLDFLEWIYRLMVDTNRAYRAISYQTEAYEHQYDYKYLENRKPYAMWRK
jgi:hypothetical protein